MRTKLMVCSVSLAMGVGCGSSGDNVTEFHPNVGVVVGADSTYGSLRAALNAPNIPVDVGQVRFSIVQASQQCSAQPVATALASLGAIANAGGDTGLAEHFFALPAGNYRLCAQPLNASGENSNDCEAGDTLVEVLAGATTMSFLSMTCQSTTGAVSAVALFNAPPVIEAVNVVPSRIINRCQSTELTAVVRDIEGDDFEVDWQAVTPGGVVSNVLGNQTSFRGEPGEHLVRLTAADSAGLASTVEIPVVVTADECGGAFPVEFSPEGGQGKALALSDDEVSVALPLGFEFEFFDQVFDSVQVSSNGFLVFGGSDGQDGCCSGQDIPQADGIDNIVAFAWSDWNPSGGGSITTRTVGEAPNRRFLVDFIVVPEFGDDGQVTAQVKLFEGSNAVEIHTTDMRVAGHTVTQGVENAAGTAAFFLAGRISSNFSLSEDAVRFFTDLGAQSIPVAQCGNLVVEFGEQCDDGNSFNGDGCDAFCQIEGGGGEECRDVFECLEGPGCSQPGSLEECSCVNNFCRTDGSCSLASDCFPGFSCSEGQCTDGPIVCTSDDECSGACDEDSGRCVDCESDEDCSFGVCNADLNECVQCRTDIDCEGDFSSVCGEAGFCSECRNDFQCLENEFCNVESGDGFCEIDNRCLSDEDCAGSPLGAVCDLSRNSCVGCTDGSQCTDGPPICSPFTQQCAECETLNDCSPGALECAENFCVECQSSRDCEPGNFCSFDSPFGGSCVFDGECQDSSECGPQQVCEQAECVVDLGCEINVGEQLFMTDLSVVDDPVRAAQGGVWSFGGLMRSMAPSAEEAPAFVEALFDTWRVDQTLNTFSAPARSQIGPLLLDAWPRTANGQLDLDRSPLTLNAIVNRIDLRDLDEGNAGEGRFVFGVNEPNATFPLQFTLIMEFKLPAQTEEDVLQWAELWHGLGEMPFPSEQYNAALQVVTDRFAGRGSLPQGVNGSALSQLRTNEIALAGFWELREFVLSSGSGALAPSPVGVTPDLSFNNSPLLAQFINENEDVILTERHLVPELFEGINFQAATSFNLQPIWDAPGINNPEARHKFALNTCSGCHGPEAGITNFLQVEPRRVGEVARLSGFLTGTTVTDPISGVRREIDDLERRRQDLAFLTCDFTPLPAPAPLPPIDGGSGPFPGPRPFPQPFPQPFPGDAGRPTQPPPFSGAAGSGGDFGAIADAGVEEAVEILFSVVNSQPAPSIRRGIGRVH